MAAVVDAPGTETPVVDAPAPATAPANGAAPAEPSWRDSLPDDLKGAAWLSKYKTPEDALRGFAEAQKLIGSKLSVPKDDAPKEEWDKFYASLGRPEAPDKYDLGVPETLPEGVAFIKEKADAFKALAHQIGLTPKQAKAIADMELKYALGMNDARTKAEARARAEGEAKLVQAWGPKDGPVYQRNLELARRLAEKAFGNDAAVLEALDGQGNNPAFLQGMAELAQLALEHEYIGGEGAATMPGRDAAEAEFNELQAQVGDDGTVTSGPAWNPRHPRYKETQAKLEQLSRIIWPDKARRGAA